MKCDEKKISIHPEFCLNFAIIVLFSPIHMHLLIQLFLKELKEDQRRHYESPD